MGAERELGGDAAQALARYRQDARHQSKCQDRSRSIVLLSLIDLTPSAAEIVEQLEAIKAALTQRAPAASSKTSNLSPRVSATPVFSPSRCAAAASDDAKSPRVPQLNFGSGSKQVGRARRLRASHFLNGEGEQQVWSGGRGNKRGRDSIDSVSSDVLRQVRACVACTHSCDLRASKASAVAVELLNMSPRDALSDHSLSDVDDDDVKVAPRACDM